MIASRLARVMVALVMAVPCFMRLYRASATAVH